MTDDKGKVTLDIEEFKSLLGTGSQEEHRTRAISLETEQHREMGEAHQKAWFSLVVSTISQLNDAVEKLRSEDIVSLKKEIKRDIEKLETRIGKDEDALEEYKKDIIGPLNDKLITLNVKIGMWGILAGFFGSGLMALLISIVRAFMVTATGTP